MRLPTTACPAQPASSVRKDRPKRTTPVGYLFTSRIVPDVEAFTQLPIPDTGSAPQPRMSAFATAGPSWNGAPEARTVILIVVVCAVPTQSICPVPADSATC